MNQNFTFKANQDKKSNSISNPNNGITVHSYGKDGFECSYERDGIKYTYYMISTPANKKKINRIKELTNQSEDGTVRLIDKEGIS